MIPRFGNLALTALAALSLALLPRSGDAQVGSNMKDQMIFHFCSKAMTADLEKAGKTPPSGMVDHTCACVVQQINGRASIEQAKAICQAQAQQKYALQ